MNRSLTLVLLTALLGCRATPRAPERPIPPPRPEFDLRAQAQKPTDEEATRRFLDSQIEAKEQQGQSPPPPTNADRYRARPQSQQQGTTNEEATRRFLDSEIERRSYVLPAPQPERVVERVYEPVYVPQYRYEDVGRYEYERYHSRFPWNTAVGAGVGAIIGHQSGHRDRGAAIGAGIGLLFDMARWH
ncbi:MAG: glycine zipper family protein [Planctomycetota bacterium]